jgi:hypothetical protein
MHHDAAINELRGRRQGFYPCRLLWSILPLVLIFLAAGCRPNKRYDLIEAELRTRDQELAQTRSALEQSRLMNRAYEQQLGQPGLPGTVVQQPVQAVGRGDVMIHDITLARGTGGVDDDGVPGDEALMVVLVPRDEDGSAVKVPARVTISAWEITPAGLKNPIGNWEVTPEKLRPTWRAGLFSSGYHIALKWQTCPTLEKVRVAVRLTTLDGRAFEADKDINVRPILPPLINPYPTTPVVPSPTPQPGREPLLPGSAPPGVPSTIPPGTEELPPPSRSY